MHTLKQVINKRPGDSGGTEIGWSSLSAFHSCPKKWALNELLPHPKGGFGVASRLSHALFVGLCFHAAMKAWYLSDPMSISAYDGDPRSLQRNYSAEAGLKALFEEAASHQESVENEENYAKWFAEARDLFRRYSAECGATGPDPEHQYFILAEDEEGPMVERFFAVPLGYSDWYMTTRVDTIGWSVDDLPITNQNAGTIVIPEHKTIDVSFRRATLLDYGLSGQLSCEYLAVRECLGHTGPIIPVINGVLKRAKGEKTSVEHRKQKGELCRVWEPMDRSERDLLKFRMDMVRRLKTMNALVEEYRELVSKGMEPLDAIEIVFDGHPPRNTCAGQGYQCTFYDLCRDKQHSRSILMATDPKFPAGADKTINQTMLEGVIDG